MREAFKSETTFIKSQYPESILHKAAPNVYNQDHQVSMNFFHKSTLVDLGTKYFSEEKVTQKKKGATQVKKTKTE